MAECEEMLWNSCTTQLIEVVEFGPKFPALTTSWGQGRLLLLLLLTNWL